MSENPHAMRTLVYCYLHPCVVCGGLWSVSGVARLCGEVGSTQAKCLWKASSIWHVWRHCAITPQPSWLTSTGPPYISHAGQHNIPYPGQTQQGGTKYFHFWEHRYWVNREKKVKLITFWHIVFLCTKNKSKYKRCLSSKGMEFVKNSGFENYVAQLYNIADFKSIYSILW